MSDRKITIVFRGGATLDFKAIDREAVEISSQWSKHIANPAQQELIGATYADGAGDLRLIASEIAGISFEDV